MVLIREESAEDNSFVLDLTELAFGQKEEADLVEKLRARDEIILSQVAEMEGQIVGHVAWSECHIRNESESFIAITMAPVSVLPKYQKQGIGSRLIEAGLKQVKLMGYTIAVVLGHPEYYPRFGFEVSKPYGIIWDREYPDEALMVKELVPKALKNISGIIRFCSAIESFE